MEDTQIQGPLYALIADLKAQVEAHKQQMAQAAQSHAEAINQVEALEGKMKAQQSDIDNLMNLN